MDQINTVITIGRQYGSGGRRVGRMVAEKLCIPYYDKEILTLAAKESGICQELFEDNDEKPSRSFLFSLVTGAQMRGGNMYMDMPINHRIFLAQFDTIRRIASQGPCVIVGRCADYVLRERPNVVNVFIHAPIEAREERVVKYYGIDADKAHDTLIKADKQRASYYNYFASGQWGHVDNYNLCLDTGAIGLDGAVDQIISFVQAKEAWAAQQE